MRARLRFLILFTVCFISLWLAIILFSNVNKQHDIDFIEDQWSRKIDSRAEPLVTFDHSSSHVALNDDSLNSSIHNKIYKHQKNEKSPQRQRLSDSNNDDVLKKTHLKSVKNLEFLFHHMDAIDIIFYQFNMKTADPEIPSTISKEEHKQACHEASFVNNDIDHYVQTEGDKKFAFNLLASNRIGLFRPLPDTRHDLCKKQNRNSDHAFNSSVNDRIEVPDASLANPRQFSKIYSNNVRPNASIVICYYNEAPSALLRTIYTVIRRSPANLLKEIIVIDDFSDHEYNSYKIKPFIEQFGIVQLHRTNQREGLIRARLMGSRMARGEVLIFLDSHVEANVGWLEPLMAQIEVDRTTVVCPMIDLINPETMIYTSSPMVVGGLTWALHFKWISVSSDKLKTYEDFIKPLDSPTMAGGLYAIDREFFHHLGEYDSAMELWGGENVEMSLRVWLCGGKIVVLPCSRVGHIFRKRRPYGPDQDKPDCLLYNSHRAARVWLGDHIHRFYKAVPEAEVLDSGDITGRISIKNDLRCRDFDWYMMNVLTELDNRIEVNHETTHKYGKLKLFKQGRRRIDRGIHFRNNNNNNNNKTHHQVQSHPSIHKMTHSFTEDPFRLDSKAINSTGDSPYLQVSSKVTFQIQLINSSLCLEKSDSPFAKGFSRLILGICVNSTKDSNLIIPLIDNIHNSTTILRNQLWTRTKDNEFRLQDNLCLDTLKTLPVLRTCNNMGLYQSWNVGDDDQLLNVNIYNQQAALCLAAERAQFGEPIIATICDKKVNATPNSANKMRFQKNNSKTLGTGVKRPRNKTRAFWHTGPDTMSQIGRYKFPTQEGFSMPIQRWNLINSSKI